MTENSRYEINFFGLDNAGKTSIIRALTMQNIGLLPLYPTKGFEFKPFNFQMETRCCTRKTVKLSLVDTGGQQTVRDFWPKLFKTGAASVFVFDAADESRFAEAFEEIRTLLAYQDVLRRPFLVFANKQDLSSKIKNEAEFASLFGGYGYMFARGSALDADSLLEALAPLFKAAVDPAHLGQARYFIDSEKKRGVAYGMTLEEKFYKLEELRGAKQ